MSIHKALGRIPGGLMLLPLLVGALINTIDQLHLGPMQGFLAWLGVPPVTDPETGQPVWELLGLGGFASALTRGGAITLIGAFLVCVAAQMDFAVGRQALKKGAIVTGTKLLVGVGLGYGLGAAFGAFDGFLGLSTVAIVAAMTNGNGGLYLALTGQYGNRSDVGAVSVISLNDGPFFTLLALGMLGERFPFAAFLAVLLPMVVGFALGQWNPETRAFLKQGERLLIPFFAFALGTSMSFASFARLEVLTGGLFLGVATVVCTGLAGAAALRLFGETSQVAAVAEASTAGNAVQTPLAVSLAAATAASSGLMSVERAARYESIVATATAQISIATITTAILCPLLVVLWCRRQRLQVPVSVAARPPSRPRRELEVTAELEAAP